MLRWACCLVFCIHLDMHAFLYEVQQLRWPRSSTCTLGADHVFMWFPLRSGVKHSSLVGEPPKKPHLDCAQTLLMCSDLAGVGSEQRVKLATPTFHMEVLGIRLPPPPLSHGFLSSQKKTQIVVQHPGFSLAHSSKSQALGWTRNNTSTYFLPLTFFLLMRILIIYIEFCRDYKKI